MNRKRNLKIIFIYLLILAPLSFSAASELTLLDAVKLTISQNPGIKLQEKGVESSRGLYKYHKGMFDVKLSAAANRERTKTPLTKNEQLAYSGISELEVETTSYQLSISKLFPWGMNLSPGLEMMRTDNISFKTDPTNYGRAFFEIYQPLLKGFGSAASAGKSSSKLNWEATELDLHHTINKTIYNTVIAYWSYIAAEKGVAILQESETRARQLVEETKALIEADEIPKSELIQLNANLADKTAARISARETLFHAKQNLALIMGIPLEQFDSLEIAAIEFPKPGEVLPTINDSKMFTQKALNLRPDFLAIQKQQQATKTTFKAAKNGLLPQLDLLIDISYTGLDEGDKFNQYFTAFNENKTGMSFSASISTQLPIQNNSAKGTYMQQKALYEQSKIGTDELQRQISYNVTSALHSLNSSAQELSKSAEAIESYRQTIENEKKKFLLGMSTLINVISYEDRLTAALLNQISQQSQYAIALITLRYETGSLIEIAKDFNSIGMEEFITIPFY